MNIRKACVSGGTLWGYETLVDLDTCENLQDIIKICITAAKDTLRSIKLIELCNTIKESDFHIHIYTFEDILMTESDFIIYICNHCILN